MSISTQSTTIGMVVSVTGTPITSTIDSSGRFVLTGVPAGDIQLRFRSNDVDATAMVTAVQSSDSITITVTITGSTATVVSDSRKGGGQQEPEPGNDAGEGQVSGAISGLTGTAPTVTFVVGTTTIHTNANTRVTSGEGGDSLSVTDDGGNDGGSGGGNDGNDGGGALTLSILQNGLTVTVEGAKQTDGSILASRINVTTVTAKGTISGLAGSCPAIQFTVGTTAVTTTSMTSFDEVRCTSLKNGTAVEVKGTQIGATLNAFKVNASGGDGEV